MFFLLKRACQTCQTGRSAPRTSVEIPVSNTDRHIRHEVPGNDTLRSALSSARLVLHSGFAAHSMKGMIRTNKARPRLPPNAYLSSTPWSILQALLTLTITALLDRRTATSLTLVPRGNVSVGVSTETNEGVLQPTVGAEDNIPSKRPDKALITRPMGSGSIHRDGVVPKKAIQSRPDECFPSPWTIFIVKSVGR